MVIQSRSTPGHKYEGVHLNTMLAQKASGGSVKAGLAHPTARSYYTTPNGFQQTSSYRTKPGESDEEQAEDFSTREMKRRLYAEHVTKYDNGHEFDTFKRTNDITSTHVDMLTSSGWRQYIGPIWPNLASVIVDPYPLYTLPTSNDVVLDGSRAIEATAPTASEAGLAQFLGELREKLPSLVGLESLRKGLSPASAGSEHLNIEFGIKPFVGDLQKLAKQVKNFRKVLDQFKRDAGVDKHVRRRIHLRDDYATTVFNDSMDLPMQITPMAGAILLNDYSTRTAIPHRVTDSIRQSAWFSGAYTYHLAEANDFLGKLERYEQLANALLGSRFDVSTVWELTPWSWLIDWHMDVGGFLHNISLLHSDSLVLRYGYVMHETRAERIYAARTPLIDRTGRQCGVPLTYYSYHRKARTRATPYGFGLNLADLTPRRWAILGALGLTKTSGKLRSDGD